MTSAKSPSDEALAATIAKNTRTTRILIVILLVVFGVPFLALLVMLGFYAYFTLTA